MYTILLVIHTILVVFLIIMVLLQRTDSDGLSGLGGGGGNQFLTGRGAANLMTRTTAILAGAFMITSLSLAVMAGHMTRSSIIDTAAPAAEETPAEVLKDAAKQSAPLKELPPATDAALAKAAAKDKVTKEAKPAAATPAVPKPD